MIRLKHLPLIWGGALATSQAMALPVINEVDADTPSTDTQEFVELYDGGVGNTSLDGYTLVFFNGSNDASYQAFDLDGYQTNESGYFVVCGDASLVANCDLDVSPDTNLIQNGADAVALYLADASDFPNGSPVTDMGLLDALVYDTNDADDTGLLALMLANQPQINEGENGNKDQHSVQRCGDLTARTSTSFAVATSTPGGANQCEDTPQVPSIGLCGETDTDGFVWVHDVQGQITDLGNDASPLVGQSVIVEAVVTMDKQGGALANGEPSYQYSGYWIQEEASDEDDNPMTSEGVFVYDYRNAVSVGDVVRFKATVSEYNQTTQLSQVSDLTVCATQAELPAARVLSLPVEQTIEFEALEGMLVESSDTLVVSDLFGTGYGFGNYGQFVVSSTLHFQPTEVAPPGSVEAQLAQEAKPLDTLLIDDGVSASYPSFIPFPDDSGFNALNPMRIGYEVSQLSGVMHGWRQNYTVIPQTILIDPTHPRNPAPQVHPDSNVVVVGMNVLNLFNGDGQGSGFPTSRGAPTVEAYEMQLAKIVAALTATNADIIGLMELENDGFDQWSAIQSLVDALNLQQLPGNEYTAITLDQATIGDDAITVGLLYRAERVSPIGNTRLLDSAHSPVDELGQPLFDDTRNRPSLIQSFEFDGDRFTVAVNHFKSKGSACDEINEGQDGQGNCNQSRSRAAQALATFLASQPTGIQTDKQLILGDLNAYSQEDPIQVFYDAEFTNLKYTEQATEAKPYSYSFGGFLGSLDHALATPALTAQVLSVDAWHINSVEDSMMDYLTEDNGQPYDSVDSYAEPDAFRSSDHDPIVIGLSLGNQAPMQIGTLPTVEVKLNRRVIEVNVREHFMDPEHAPLTFKSDNLPVGLTLSSQGTVTGKLSRRDFAHLPMNFDMEVSDGQKSILVQVSITPASDPFTQWLYAVFQWLQGLGR